MDEQRYTETLQFALKNEQDAAAMYEKYRNVVKSRAAQELLKAMAAQERGHAKKLELILAKGRDTLAKASEQVQDLRVSDYLFDMGLKADSPIEDVFIFAMKCEERAKALYTRMAAAEKDPQARQTFESLAKEEGRHKLDLETEFDKGVLTEN